MSVVTCKEYCIVFTKKQLDALLRAIASWGKFEPVNPFLPLFGDTYQDSAQRISRLKQNYHDAISFLENEQAPSELHTQEEIEKNLAQVLKTYDQTEKNMQILVEKVTRMQKDQETYSLFHEKTREIRTLLEKIGHVSAPIFQTHELFSSRLISIPTPQREALSERVSREEGYALSELYSGAVESIFVLIRSLGAKTDIWDELTKTYEAKELVIDPQFSRYTPHALKQELETRLESLQASASRSQSEAREYYQKNQTVFKCVVDLLSYEEQVSGLYRYIGFFTGEFSKEDAQKIELLKQGNQFQLKGWIAPGDVRAFENLIKTVDPAISIEQSDIHEESEVRTVLQNNTWIKPFEIITKLMGVPSPKEIDPTPFLSPFFILFFGFALGDGGYGIIMLAISLFGLYRMKLSESMREAMLLIFMCSLSTIFFGAITGSWFGVNLDYVPGAFGTFLKSLKQFDMQRSLLMILAGSIGIGFFHQIVGLFLEMAVYIKNKEYVKALASPGTWILFLGAIIVRVAVSSLGASEEMVTMSTYLLYGAFGAFLIGQGIETRPIFLIPLVGLTQLFNITGFLSNSLSYARLLALGLATGVIAGVINFLADLFGGTDSILGIITMIFILIIGHTVNIGLNVLGTFINVLRLQLVEFFPRFFNAQGVELSPAKLSPAFYTVSEQMAKTYTRNFPIIITNLRKKIV